VDGLDVMAEPIKSGRVQADDLLSAVLRVDARKPAVQADPLGFQRLDPVDQGLADGGHVAVDLDGDPVQFTLIQRLVPTTAIRPIPSFDINPSSVGGVICAPFCGASATA
jgi:hypothetical protein